LTDFQISDKACRPISTRFGDENAKHVLNPGQVWQFTCTRKIDADTTNEVTVHAKDGSNDVTASDSNLVTMPFHSDGKSVKVHEEKNASKGQPGESTLHGDSNGKALKVHGESGAAQIMVKIHADRHEVQFGGGSVKFDYEVTNPGKFALTDFQISDNACRPISARFGDKKSKVGFGDEKAKHVLNPGQVRHFTCVTKIDADTTNKVTVHAKDGSNDVTASDSNLVTVGAGTAVTMTPTQAATSTLVKKPGSTPTRVSKSGSTPTRVSKSGSTPVASATPGASVSKSGSTPVASATPTASAGSVSKSGSTPVASATPTASGGSVSKSGSTPVASATPTASGGSVSKSGSTPVASATPTASVSKSGSTPTPVTPTFPNTGLENDGASSAWNLALPLGAAAVVFLIVAMRRRQLN
jgi:hypothetical protein